MAVSLTPIAFERVQRFVAQTPGALGLRFGVTKTGCSGWGHVTDLARDEREGSCCLAAARAGAFPGRSRRARDQSFRRRRCRRGGW